MKNIMKRGLTSSLIKRGNALGPGKSTWVRSSDLIYANAIPKGLKADDSIEKQTKMAFEELEKTLVDAGISTENLLEATVFLKDMKHKDEMDKVWQNWAPASGISRAAIGGCNLGKDIDIQIKATAASSDIKIVKGESPGIGRTAWTKTEERVYTVAFPKGVLETDTVAQQTKKCLEVLDERLQKAGTDKNHILEATIYLKDRSASTLKEMDEIWREYIPESCGVSRAAIGGMDMGSFLVEMKISAALPNVAIIRGPSPGKGRSSFVTSNNLVNTVAFPKGFKPDHDMEEQTRLSLKELDVRLDMAGTDKSQLMEVTVYLTDYSTRDIFDKKWQEYIPENCGVSLAYIGNVDIGSLKLEIKVTAAVPPSSKK